MATGNAKNFELKIGKTGLIIILTGMTAFLCAAFLFGVDVGKNIDTYPGNIASLPQKALAMIWRPAKIRVAQNTPDNKTGQNNPKNTQESQAPKAEENMDLTFYNTLTSKKGLSGAESSMGKKPYDSQLKNEEEALKGKFNIETQKKPETENPNNNVKDEYKAKETSLNTAASKCKFIVQAASLKEKSKAKQINKKIASLGFKTEIIKAEIKGKGIVFRIIASGFDNKFQAEQAAQKISSQTGTNCIIKKIDNTTNKN